MNIITNVEYPGELVFNDITILIVLGSHHRISVLRFNGKWTFQYYFISWWERNKEMIFTPGNIIGYEPVWQIRIAGFSLPLSDYKQKCSVWLCCDIQRKITYIGYS